MRLLATALSLATLLGYLAAVAPAPALLLALGPALVLAMRVSPAGWVFAALLLAIGGRGLASVLALAGLPGTVSLLAYLHLVVAWAGLGLAAIRARQWSSTSVWLVVGVLALTLAAVLSAVANGSQALRVVFYVALLGEPFAIVATLLLCPPSPRTQKAIVIGLVALLIVQVPIAIAQAILVGTADPVTGTLTGATGGAHLLGGIVTAGAIWLYYSFPSSLARNALLLALIPVPFLSDAKQVILTLPIVLLATWRPWRHRGAWVVPTTIVGLALVLFAVPALSQYSQDVIERSLTGEGGKVEALRVAERGLTSGLQVATVGEGPAETISHAAFLTLDPLRLPDSPVRSLNLEPAQVGRAYLGNAYGGTFASPRSSAFGLLGDLGLLGAIVYAGLVCVLLLAMFRIPSPEATAGIMVLLLMAFLGFLGDWWEQGDFTVVVATIVAFGLLSSGAPASSGTGRPTLGPSPADA